MEFRRRQIASQGKRVALVPGSYNPPTIAHRALIESALDHADEVVAVMPRTFPHKSYEGVPLEDRIRMLERVSAQPYSIAISEGGLFLEMCDEFQRVAGPAEVSIVCGRDAAERILTWDYGPSVGVLDRMFEQFSLLVAARRGEFEAPAQFRDRVRALGIAGEHDALSSTEVRERIRSGAEWRHLVPESVAPLVERFYLPE
jgi:cytidyltransferase-like protein